MPSPDDSKTHSISVWIQAAKEGDDTAAQRLFERYFEAIANISRNRVARKRRVEDEDDAAIVTLNAILAGLASGKYPDVNDRTSLWPLLIDIVIKNSKKQIRKDSAEKRGGGLVSGESVFIRATDGEMQFADFALDQICDQDSIELAEVIQKLRADLSEDDQAILDLKLEQRSNREIAKLLGRPSRSVDRRIANEIVPKLLAILQSD